MALATFKSMFLAENIMLILVNSWLETDLIFLTKHEQILSKNILISILLKKNSAVVLLIYLMLQYNVKI